MDLRLPEYVDDHAEMLSQWEAKSRYVVGYAIERAKARRALAEVDDYLVAIAERERQQIANDEG